jgi:hypothetical protein
VGGQFLESHRTTHARENRENVVLGGISRAGRRRDREQHPEDRPREGD